MNKVHKAALKEWYRDTKDRKFKNKNSNDCQEIINKAYDKYDKTSNVAWDLQEKKLEQIETARQSLKSLEELKKPA